MIFDGGWIGLGGRVYLTYVIMFITLVCVCTFSAVVLVHVMVLDWGGGEAGSLRRTLSHVRPLRVDSMVPVIIGW